MTLTAEQWDKTVEAARATAEQLCAGFKEVIERIMPAARQLSETLRATYIEAGAPYGDTHEGMMRWMDECNEAAALETRAESIRQHHLLLADMRKQLKKSGRG